MMVHFHANRDAHGKLERHLQKTLINALLITKYIMKIQGGRSLTIGLTYRTASVGATLSYDTINFIIVHISEAIYRRYFFSILQTQDVSCRNLDEQSRLISEVLLHPL